MVKSYYQCGTHRYITLSLSEQTELINKNVKIGLQDERINKKLSYCWETVRREGMPRIAEMDVEMTTYAEMTFKCTSMSSKVAPIES